MEAVDASRLAAVEAAPPYALEPLPFRVEAAEASCLTPPEEVESVARIPLAVAEPSLMAEAREDPYPPLLAAPGGYL